MSAETMVKLAVIVMVLLAVQPLALGAVDCHDGHHGDDECGPACSHVCCAHAILSISNVTDLGPSYHSRSAEVTPAIPHVLADGVFQPPKSTI